MPDYGPMPRIKRVSPTPVVTRTKGFFLQKTLEEKLMGRVIYEAGKLAGKQAAVLAYRHGMRSPEELKFVRNFAQDKARSDTLRLLEELQNSRKGFPEITVEGKLPGARKESI